MSGTRTDFTQLVDGLPPRGRSPGFWAFALSELMDVLMCAAIYLSNEVQTWPFAAVAVLTAIRWFTSYRLRTLFIATGYLLILFLAFILFSRMEMHPITAAAHVAPIALAWMGMSHAAERLWGWRMGLGFVGLILASAVSPDFSVMILIVAFIVSGSIALSCRYLDTEFVRRGVVGTLPVGFIRTSLNQTGTLFLAALIIFPLIPRMQGRAGGFGGDTSRTGYTEEVSLSEWSRVSNRGSSATALRIYGPNGTDPHERIPAGLLRSRVLSILGERRWDPGPVRIETQMGQSEGELLPDHLTIVREMIGPAYLPVPYGSHEVSVELYGYRWRSERTRTGEWREGRSRNQRFNYLVKVGDRPKLAPQDQPTAVESAVPDVFRTERMAALAERLFQNRKTPAAKIDAIMGMFGREGFRASYAEDEAPKAENSEGQELPPIERFLFVEKSGHCELFASSMAILLRLGGIPTRLVAGFRVGRDAIGDVLTVRQSDAHAWVEAYIPGHGWTVVDPTPKTVQVLAITDWIRDSYDWASAKWTQYILNYGEGDNSLRQRWEALKKIGQQVATGKNPFKASDTEANLYLFAALFLIGTAAASSVAIFVLRRLRRSRAPAFRLDRVRRGLVIERRKIERIRRKIASAPPTPERFEIFAATENWLARYETIRFGRSADKREILLKEVRALRSEGAQLGKEARKVS